jgi:hypothetical protein
MLEFPLTMGLAFFMLFSEGMSMLDAMPLAAGCCPRSRSGQERFNPV